MILVREVHVHQSTTLSRSKVDGVCRTTQNNKKDETSLRFAFRFPNRRPGNARRVST